VRYDKILQILCTFGQLNANSVQKYFSVVLQFYRCFIHVSHGCCVNAV